ncbi:hypothetical protein ABZ352_35655 [Streptomyces griseofuscus]
MTEDEIDRLEARAEYVADPILADEMRDHATELRARLPKEDQ